MFRETPKYQIRILRFWTERHQGNQDDVSWRFSLENPDTGERRNIPDLDSLLNILQAEIRQASQKSISEGGAYDQISR